MTSKVRAPKHNHRSPCYGYNGPIQFHWVDVVRSGVGHKDVAKKLRNISPRVVRLFEVGDLHGLVPGGISILNQETRS